MKRLILYGIGGVLTTAVNYVFYFALCAASVSYLAANTAAWAAAVVFSYRINQRFVFCSHGGAREFLSFCSLRFLTLLAENALLLLLIGVLAFPAGFSKLAVSIVTVAANYGVCRLKIFRAHPSSARHSEKEVLTCEKTYSDRPML